MSDKASENNKPFILHYTFPQHQTPSDMENEIGMECEAVYVVHTRSEKAQLDSPPTAFHPPFPSLQQIIYVRGGGTSISARNETGHYYRYKKTTGTRIYITIRTRCKPSYWINGKDDDDDGRRRRQ